MGVNGVHLLAWSDPLDWDNRRLLEVARMMALHATAYALTTLQSYMSTLLTGDREILNGDPTW